MKVTPVAALTVPSDHRALLVNVDLDGVVVPPPVVPPVTPPVVPPVTPPTPPETPVTYEAPSPPVIFARMHGSASNKPIKRIVIHCTAGPGDEPDKGGARETANYFKNLSGRYASAHYVVDTDEVIQCVYDSVQAYHAPPNQHSLGIELRCSLSNEGKGHWDGANHQKMLKRAARLTAELCLAYGVPATKLSVNDLKAGRGGLCGHVDVSNAWHQTNHWDPGPYFPWAQFVAYVNAEITAIKKGTTVPTSKPKNKVQTGRDLIAQGIALLHAANEASDRPAVENMADKIAADLADGPKS